jgi:hypothetical protein
MLAAIPFASGIAFGDHQRVRKPSMPFTVWPATVLLVVACAAPAPASTTLAREASAHATIEPGATFNLRAGEFAQTADGAWRVGFEGVTADSRCPKGERCVWAGDATVRIWLQKGTGPKQTHELQAAAGAAQAVRVLDQELRLVRLDPYPVSGKAVERAAYIATLIFTRSAAAAPDR